MTRIYVPATIDELSQWHAAGSVPAAAFADAYEAPDETEEGEYAALMSAADASAERLAGPGRRLVLVVDAGAAAPVPFREVLAVHADLDERPADADADEDLAWFGVQEIPALLG
ncbi:hypothetical protein Back2_09940 [Nocardioides baekrokdamisoli]|uniref:Uncharacterized protein n=1 Tax=Nocardioides baekrokdamisoli TaxID=1804624 RepID=A0A3G9ICP0_9ACTN|nr:hypothetical protein [Nocardioides baekrokdamisoli]BBH16707.1 hypothetical protein Back2_09940 [Nocardioides baekrokdamisoli]